MRELHLDLFAVRSPGKVGHAERRRSGLRERRPVPRAVRPGTVAIACKKRIGRDNWVVARPVAEQNPVCAIPGAAADEQGQPGVLIVRRVVEAAQCLSRRGGCCSVRLQLQAVIQNDRLQRVAGQPVDDDETCSSRLRRLIAGAIVGQLDLESLVVDERFPDRHPFSSVAYGSSRRTSARKVFIVFAFPPPPLQHGENVDAKDVEATSLASRPSSNPRKVG